MGSNIQKVINKIKKYCKKCPACENCNEASSSCPLVEFKDGKNPYKIKRKFDEATLAVRIENMRKAREKKRENSEKK